MLAETPLCATHPLPSPSRHHLPPSAGGEAGVQADHLRGRQCWISALIVTQPFARVSSSMFSALFLLGTCFTSRTPEEHNSYMRSTSLPSQGQAWDFSKSGAHTASSWRCRTGGVRGCSRGRLSGAAVAIILRAEFWEAFFARDAFKVTVGGKCISVTSHCLKKKKKGGGRKEYICLRRACPGSASTSHPARRCLDRNGQGAEADAGLSLWRYWSHEWRLRWKGLTQAQLPNQTQRIREKLNARKIFFFFNL